MFSDEKQKQYVVLDCSGESVGRFTNQNEAFDLARNMVRRTGTQHIVLKENGSRNPSKWFFEPENDS